MNDRKERTRGPGLGGLLRRTGAAAFAPFEMLVERQYAAPWRTRARETRGC